MDASEVRPDSLRERKRQRMRDDLYDAAMQLFRARPYAEVTVDEICERGMSGRATFFRLYGSKAGLLAEYNRRLTEQVKSALAAAAPGTPRDELKVVAEVIAAGWGPDHPFVAEMARDVIASLTYTKVDSDIVPTLEDLIGDIL